MVRKAWAADRGVSRPAPGTEGAAVAGRDGAQEMRWSGLMRRAQDGDAVAYAALLRECRPLIRAICARHCNSPEETEDAVQDTMLTIHMIRHTYDPARPFGPWLAAIARRRAIDRGRGRARRLRHEAAFAIDPAMGQDRAASPDILAEDRLRTALAGLPASQRAALCLTKLEEMTLIDASGRSGMTVAALKVATSRAMRTLRRHFGGGP